jgi:hypothetical protein
MLRTKCLVLGSCTGQKDALGCPEDLKLQESDFSSVSALSKAEHKAKDWLKPAAQMYTGRQHALMMTGIRHLRSSFNGASFDVAIVSAGYGLISEDRLIAPYNITFQGQRLPLVRERGRALNIPAMTRKLLSQYQIIFFLLGKEYLASMDGPLEATVNQTFIYFGTGASNLYSSDSNAITLQATQKESTLYRGAGVTGIKGRMFELFAKGISSNPDRWKTFVEDRTSNTIMNVLEEALRAI